MIQDAKPSVSTAVDVIAKRHKIVLGVLSHKVWLWLFGSPNCEARIHLLIRHNRNLSIDFFRGIALWWIFIDHTPNNRLEQLTFRHLGFCDAFEIFVLLAGLSASYAYGLKFFRRGAVVSAMAILRRIGVIYMANFVLICGLWAEVALLDESRTGQSIVDILEIDGLRNMSIDKFGALLTFRYQCSMVDILPLYILLLLGFAIVLPLLRFPRVLLSLSFGLYVATYLCNLHIPGVEGSSHIYNPLAWQLLLMTGAVLVIQPLPRSRLCLTWDIVAVSVLLVAFAVRLTVHFIHNSYGPGSIGSTFWAPILGWMQDSTLAPGWKTRLHPLRVINIFAWAWLAYRLAPFKWLRYSWARTLILCGQHSLALFCFGVLLAPLGGMFLATWSGMAAQLIYNVAGAAIMVLIAALAAAHQSKRSQFNQSVSGGEVRCISGDIRWS